jgi:hypothetical protein
MSLSKKVVTTYAKSLFQNVNNSGKKSSTFDVTNVTSTDSSNVFIPDVHIIGEELLLLRSILITSKKLLFVPSAP